jgi:uncharacterized protein (DUF885 family)
VRRLLVALLLGLGASCSFYGPGPEGDEGVLPELRGDEAASFRSLADAALAALWAAYPEQATFDGIHDNDAQLGDWSRGAVEGRIASFRRHLARVDALPLGTLPDDSYYDALLLASRLRAELLELEEIRGWQRDPGHYCDVISEGLYGLAALRFGSPERRRALAVSRLRDVPGLLASARANLAEPPKLFVEMAIDDFGGLLSFLKADLPRAFGGPPTDPAFGDALKLAVANLELFVEWLRKDVLPKAAGSYALGADLYARKLLHQEMVDVPLDELLARGRELLRATRERLTEAAGGTAPEEALRQAAKDVPPADKLLEETRGLLGGLRRWASTVVDLPDAPDPTVQETPAFRRSTSFASMQLPGPFETEAREAYYSITLPEPAWAEERKAQHLAFFSRPSLALISVHEAWPGHYAQVLRSRDAGTRVRRALGSAAFSEGWAHYCEELYAEAEPAVRLQQLQLALLRICRYVAAISIHAKGMTVEQAADFFVKEGLQTRAAAEREARRGAVDPLYLVYTLGKAEILQLRRDWRAKTGGSDRDFHNALLALGAPPLKLARLMLVQGRPRE